MGNDRGQEIRGPLKSNVLTLSNEAVRAKGAAVYTEEVNISVSHPRMIPASPPSTPLPPFPPISSP